MTADALRERLRAGETLPGVFLVLNAPLGAEVMAAAGVDWVLIDLEHGAASEGELVGHLHAAAASGLPGLVRIAAVDRVRAGRALDQGAVGVMFPRVDDATSAAEAVAALRYPPEGVRGVATSHRAAGFGLGDVAAAMRRLPLTIVQIESVESVAVVGEIAAVPGVDVVFVGPRDLRHAIAASGAENVDAAFDEALTAVAEAAAAAGVAAGIFLADPADGPRMAARGFQLIALGSDGGLLARAGRAAVMHMSNEQDKE